MGISQSGTPAIHINEDSISETCCITMMIGIHPDGVQQNPVFLSYRDGTNTSVDFSNFVHEAVEAGFLVPGDVLVCDNAAIHKAPFITAELKAWLAERMITIVYLPTYSPELNPCEMVFGFVKNSLLHTRSSQNSFLDEVNDRFNRISAAGMERFYLHCMNQ